MKTKVASLALLLTLIFPIMAKSQVKIQQTAGRDALGDKTEGNQYHHY